jgi:hypothetical protein
MWNPDEHSEEENARWCWLRAIEWGRWPLFLSQSVAPLLLLRLPVGTVVAVFVALNLLWAGVRYRFVSVPMATAGALIALPKWLVCAGCALYLYYAAGDTDRALVALLWPLIVLLIGVFPTTRAGVLEARFQAALGLTDAWLACGE